ncbi:hypothetical protein HMPREF9182_0808 [Streptococcus sp. oral taxon 056 str. F0418]|nr:hypothetical protein HMPREF9182_0808 [Streptococcus sp. oral taxon 056 str. F0418]
MFDGLSLLTVACTLVRLVQFSKVFTASGETTILVYHLLTKLSTTFLIFYFLFDIKKSKMMSIFLK